MRTLHQGQRFAYALSLLLAVPAAAQISGGGTIKGTVVDPSGATIPGAVVAATNTATGVEYRREAPSGLYVIAPVPVGTYKLTATAAGFRTLVRENIVVDALSTVEVDLKLEVGPTAESVTVSGIQAELNTSDPRMGQTMRNEMYTALPLNMGNGSPRNPAAFSLLMPGVPTGWNLRLHQWRPELFQGRIY